MNQFWPLLTLNPIFSKSNLQPGWWIFLIWPESIHRNLMRDGMFDKHQQHMKVWWWPFGQAFYSQWVGSLGVKFTTWAFMYIKSPTWGGICFIMWYRIFVASIKKRGRGKIPRYQFFRHHYFQVLFRQPDRWHYIIEIPSGKVTWQWKVLFLVGNIHLHSWSLVHFPASQLC